MKEKSNTNNINMVLKNPRYTRPKNVGGIMSSQKPTSLENCGKSKSCEDSYDPVSPTELQQELEIKRNSIYCQECKGRNDAELCNKCQMIANKVIFFVWVNLWPSVLGSLIPETAKII